MERPTLYSWSAKRAGASITIDHSCGKITNIKLIEPEMGTLIATGADGRKFVLHV